MHPREEPHIKLVSRAIDIPDAHHVSIFNCVAVASMLLVVIILVLHTSPFSKSKPKFGSRVECLNIFKILLVCGTFMVVGPLLMVLNKEILQTLRFEFPLTLSGLGLLTTSIVIRSFIACGFGEVRAEAMQATVGRAWYHTILPIAAAKAATLACGNTVYLHLGLGFIQMLKAVNPVIVVVVMRICGLPVPSRLALWSVCLIIVGTLVEVRGELHATFLGVFFMMSSEIMEAVNLVLTQKVLQTCKFTVTEGLYMIAPPSCFLLFSAASILEWPRLIREDGHRIIEKHPWHFIASCSLGLIVNFVGMAVVQATSSLTLKVLNTARGVGVVFVGVLFYGEYVSPAELCGYGCALAGFSLYNYAQMRAS